MRRTAYTLIATGLMLPLTMSLVANNPFSLDSMEIEPPWTMHYKPDSIYRLTENDFHEVARELGVEVAAIKAVVEVEAGVTHQGFSAPSTPLVNFDMNLYRSFASKRGINLTQLRNTHPQIFSSTSRSQSAVNTRLSHAMKADSTLAVDATFWGMFQIGGFNRSKCGVESISDWLSLMKRSERDQLELFAKFITNTGLLKHLKSKNWAAFARGYNGNSYAAHGYHTKLARAYKKYATK